MAFVTGAFPRNQYPHPDHEWQTTKRWYSVIHCFDRDGNHLRTDAWNAGSEADDRQRVMEAAVSRLDEMVTGLRSPKKCRIRVRPFSHLDGEYVFGLFLETSPTDPENEWAMLQPNDVMFHPPWSGEYSS